MISTLFNFLKKNLSSDLNFKIETDFLITDLKTNVVVRDEINKIIKKIYETYVDINFVKQKILKLNSSSYNAYCFYFFDEIIENLELSAGSIKDIYDSTILKMCNINYNNLYNVSLQNHAMCFYNFEYNDRNYLIFSNSGLGINNCQFNSDNFINNKLYYYNKDFDIELLLIFIINLSNKIYDITIGLYLKESIDELINLLEITSYPKNINKTDLIKDLENLSIISNDQQIDFLYMILDYYTRKNIDEIYPCNFQHILDGDSQEYTNYVLNLNKDYTDLKSFKTKYQKPINFTTSTPCSENFRNFITYVNDLNIIINNINLPSFHYNSPNKTINVDNSGLVYSYQQQSGSCVFYSVFNILILMLFLNNFKNNDSNNVIISLLTLNYIFLLLLCSPYEKDFLLKSNIRGSCPYNSNQIVFINYIYENVDFLYEINNFYPKKTIFDIDMPINYYYNTSINQQIEKMPNNVSIHDNVNYSILLELSKKIYFIIHDIRRLELQFIDSSVKKIIYDFFDNLYNYYDVLYQDANKSRFRANVRDYCNGYKDIYIIYLCWLIKIYNEKSFIFIDSNNESSEKNFIYDSPTEFKILVPFSFNIYKINKKYESFANFVIKQYGAIDLYKLEIETYSLTMSYNHILLYFNYDELSSFSNAYLKEYIEWEPSTNIFINNKYEFINQYLNFGYFENLKYIANIHFIEHNKQIDKNNFILNNNNKKNDINKYIPINKKDEYYLNVFEQYIYYYNVYQYSDSKYQLLNEESLETFKQKLIKLTIDTINENFYNDSFLMLYIFVLSNFEVLCIDNNNNLNYFNYIHLLNKNTIFINYNLPNLNVKIKEIILKTNDYVDNIKQLFNILAINYKIIKDKLETNKFILIENTNEQTLFSKNNIIYELLYSKTIYFFSCNEYTFHEDNNYGLVSALNRFGINVLDNHLMLIPTNKSYWKKTYKLIIDINHPIYIFITNNDSYLEINFTKYYTVDYNNCILYKNNQAYKLILNADFKSVPFLKLLPPITPFLLYKADNYYNIDIILSKNSNFNSDMSLFPSKFKFNNNKNNISSFKNNKYIYLTFVVSDSLFMPINNKFINDYHKLLYYYGINKNNQTFNLKFDNEYLKNKFKYVEDVSFEKNIIIIKNFFLQLSRNISIDTNLNKELLQLFKNNNASCEMDFDKILKQNRLCTYYTMNNDCLIQKEKLISYINIYIEQLLNKIYNKYKSSNEIIIQNMNEILKIRICNYVITILSSINKDSKCWDIQQQFTYFDNVLFLLNNLKKKSFFYKYEILYLLSNSFIFNEEQFSKYRDILDNLIENNPNLNLNHFLMGKGKSSFLTPILSMGIIILKKKNVSIITAEHLIDDMREYVSFYEYILANPIQIETPSYAKKNFLMITSDLKNNQQIKKEQKKDDFIEILEIIKQEEPFNIKINDQKISYSWKLNDDFSDYINSFLKNSDEKWLDKNYIICFKNKKQNKVSINHIIEFNNNIKKKIDKIINKNDFLINSVSIIDEFDLHYNYISSMFNIVSSNNIINIELFKYICLYLYYDNIQIFEETIKKEILFISDVFPVVNITELKNNYIQSNFMETLKNTILQAERDSNEIKIKKKKLHQLIDKTCEQLKIKKYNLDYGFDNVQNKANNLCIPYIRKSTPMTGSKFSDLLLTIIFTIDFYKNNEYKLRKQDFEFLDKNPFLYWKIFNIPFEEKHKIKDETDKYKLIKILIDYLYNTNATNDLKYSIEQYNCSFQDIIYNKYNQLQVGYTGTAFIKLRNNYQYPEDHCAFRNIILDNDLYMELYLALSCYGKTNKINYTTILDKAKLTNFNVKRSSGYIENNWKISNIYNYDSEMVDCENDHFTKKIHINDIIKYNPDIYSIPCRDSNDEILKIIKDEQPFKIKLSAQKISDGWKLSNIYYIDDNNVNCYKKEQQKIVSINEIIEVNIKIKNKIYNLINNNKNEDYTCKEPYIIKDSDESIIKEIEYDINLAKNIINYIFEQDQTINRGIVDICGIFSDITNIDISKIILTHKQENIIVYFDEKHNAYGITDVKKQPSIYNNKPTNLHFYYYDQTHCVGKDLKTPQVGNVAILIDNKTRMTEFLQGIFRFRNLNKGTYLSFYICKSVGDKLTIQKISGEIIYNILNTNEQNFQENQEMGLNLQFFKTLVRYKNNEYKEIPFKPLFIENIDQESNYERAYLDKLIINLSENDINRDLYNYFLHRDNIYQFKSIILNNNSIETSNEVQNQKQIENQRQNKIDISRIQLIDDIKLDFLFIHYNCSICAHFIGKPLFNNEYFKIDKKNIYVSNNLILKNNYPYIDDLCFIVMNNLILIEKYSVCQFYYYNKFPCYEFKSCKLLNIGITKKINLEFETDINSQIFINLFGLYVKKIYNTNIEIMHYKRFCNYFNLVAFNFLYIYYLIYFNKDNLYIFDPILYEYKNDDDIINVSINDCYITYDNLKTHISGETFDIDQIIIKTGNFELIKDNYITYEDDRIENLNEPYTDDTAKYENILTLRNKMKYDQHYKYQNYF